MKATAATSNRDEKELADEQLKILKEQIQQLQQVSAAAIYVLSIGVPSTNKNMCICFSTIKTNMELKEAAVAATNKLKEDMQAEAEAATSKKEQEHRQKLEQVSPAPRQYMCRRYVYNLLLTLSIMKAKGEWKVEAEGVTNKLNDEYHRNLRKVSNHQMVCVDDWLPGTNKNT